MRAARLRRPDRADPAPCVAGPERRARRRSRASPLFGCFGHLNETKRIDGARPRVHPRPRAPPRRAPPARRLASRPPRPARAARGRRAPRLRPRGRALVADGRLRRDRQPPLADDGRDLGQRDPRALARQAARRQRRRLVRRASRRRRDQGAGRRARGGHADRRARGAHRPERPCARWAPPRSSWSSASTGVDRVAEAYAAALEELAGGPAVQQTGRSTRSRRPRPRSASRTRPKWRRACGRSALAAARATAATGRRETALALRRAPSRSGAGWPRSSSSRR